MPHHEPVSHRLSVIPEQAENTLDRMTAVDPVVMTTELDPHAHEDMHTETDLSQVGWVGPPSSLSFSPPPLPLLFSPFPLSPLPSSLFPSLHHLPSH